MQIEARIRHRLATVREKMDRKNMFCLIVSTGEHVYYLTEFFGAFDATVMITPNAAFLIFDKRFQGMNVPETYTPVCIKDKRDLSPVIRALKRYSRIFVTDTRISVMKKWESLLGHELRISTYDPVAQARMYKDEHEINMLKDAQRITEEVMETLFDNDIFSLTENEIAKKIQINLLRAGADDVSFAPIVAADENSAIPHAVSGEKTPTNMLLIDCGAQCKHYAGDCTRTVILRDVSPKLMEMVNIVEEVHLRVVKSISVGMRIGEIDKQARSIFRKYRMDEYYNHSLGHGVGINVHELPYIHSRNHDMFSPGMVFTVEPGIYVPGEGGVRLENVYYINPKGIVECLNHTSLCWSYKDGRITT